jgi:hypothetical protein
MISVRGLARNSQEKNDRASTTPSLIIQPFGLRPNCPTAGPADPWVMTFLQELRLEAE